MISVPDVGIILFPSPRARAYLQAMEKVGICPEHALLVEREYLPWLLTSPDIKERFFDLERNEKDVIEAMGIDHSSVTAESINDPSILDSLKKRPQKTFIYTGGGIAKKEVLAAKRLLHVHPGIVPFYRGSTCFYYSILTERKIGASAFFLDSEIDTGDVLGTREFSVPGNVNIDCILDPYFRSQMLVDILE